MSASEPARWPGVSIVVPVRDAEKTLHACIEALLGSDYDGDWELLLVDNASRDGSGKIMNEFLPRVRVLHESVRGASAARNRGILESRYELIAFTDADCVPHTDWLRELVKCHLLHPSATFVGGKIAARECNVPVAMYSAKLFDQDAAINKFRPPYVITANVLARRSDLTRIGMFNLEYLRSQDVELSFRAWFRHGANFQYAPRAIVDHANIATVSELWRKAVQHGCGSARIWRDFESELGCSVTRRIRNHKPYIKALRQAISLAPRLLMRRRIAESQLNPYYDAVFELGKQISFTLCSIRYRGTGES